MQQLTDQWDSSNYKDPERQRYYLKDIDCPEQWHRHLKQLIPPPLFYMNEGPEAYQGPGSKSVPAPKSQTDRMGKAGDLMSSLPPNMRAQNLMCYIGHEGTYTPAHQEMCASLGQNIMVEASDGSQEGGKPTKPGSSIWFMTETKDRKAVSEYWISTLGHDIDIEDHFAQINAWKSAPFKTYIVEQKPGDFVLVPPLAAHQVWNRGTRTMKVAWNRTTVETLEKALGEALPRAKMVCRDEQYKVKAIVYHTLERYSKLLNMKNVDGKSNSAAVEQLRKDFGHLFSLFNRYIMLPETFSATLPREKNVEFVSGDGGVMCSYCRCNIFNRFLTCPWCIDGENMYDVCLECYAMGRSCVCVSKLKWAEQFRWKDLTEKHKLWRQQLGSDLPLAVQREQLDKKTLAEVCQEQLRRRPWIDPNKPAIETSDERSDSDSHSRPKKSRSANKNSARCHICQGLEPPWKHASCSECNLSYCYGSLFRAFGIEPLTVMEQRDWKCPKCLKFCSCGKCYKNPAMKPAPPPRTLLGHDTKKVADPRSTESLVDFRVSNLRWFKRAADDESTQPKPKSKKRRKDGKEKHRTGEHLQEVRPADGHMEAVAMEETSMVEGYSNGYGDIPVDPALQLIDTSIFASSS